MSEGPRDPVGELASQMEAAGALIDSLEAEVADLRRDLEGASAAVRAAQEEVARAREARDEEVSAVRAEMTDLRTQHADEQLRLRNRQIRELAQVREQMEEQRRQEVAAAGSEERISELKEEVRRERESAEERHRAELEAVKLSSEQWEEKLREGYRELEERHRVESEGLKQELERERLDVESRLRSDYEGLLGEERVAAAQRHEEALQTLRSAAAGRELELQKDYQGRLEAMEAQTEALRKETSEKTQEAEARYRAELREVKRRSEERERELRRSQATRLAEAKEAAERRIAALKAQREADNRALMARGEEDILTLRREYEERLAAEDERRKAETWALEERLGDARVQRETERETYRVRLAELEAARLAHDRESQEDLERAARGFGEDVARLEVRVDELEEALQESETLRSGLETEHDELRRLVDSGEVVQSARGSGETTEEGDERLRELDAQRVLAEERILVLERQLEEARGDARRNAEDLEVVRASLRRLSDPEHRLRAGIELFNESEHTRTVASISRGLGLPRVSATTDGGDAGKPVLTFVWDEISWRRYVADPTEGVEEPRVYLIGTSNDPTEIEDLRPNARMNANGHLTLGVQAR